jgi:hypothetical protein
LTEGHRFDHSFCQAQDNVWRVGDPIAPRANADSLIRNPAVFATNEAQPFATPAEAKVITAVNVRGEKRLKNRRLTPIIRICSCSFCLTPVCPNNHRLQPESPPMLCTEDLSGGSRNRFPLHDEPALSY